MSNTSFKFQYRRHFSSSDPNDIESDEEEEFENPDDPDDPAKLRRSGPEQKSTGKSIDSISGLTLVCSISNNFWSHLTRFLSLADYLAKNVLSFLTFFS